MTTDQAKQISQSISAQGKKATGVTNFVGTPVLQGNISELGLNQLLQQAQSQAQGGGHAVRHWHARARTADRPRQPMALSEDQRALLQLLIAGETL